MAIIRFAHILRGFVGGPTEMSAEGSTLAEVLTDLYQSDSKLKEQIQPHGDLNPLIAVYINWKDVRNLQGLETNICSTDTITFSPVTC